MVAAVLFLSGVAGAASVAELKAKAKISEEAGVKAGFVLEPVSAPTNPCTPSAEQQASGVVLFQAPIERWFKGRAPSADEVPGKWEITVARGETAAILAGVQALADKPGLVVRAPAKPQENGVDTEIFPLVMVPMSQGKKVSTTGVMGDSAGAQAYARLGLWLADNGPVEVKKGESLAWVVRVSADAKAAGGKVQIPLEVTEGEGGKVVAKAMLQVNVLPFALMEPADCGYTYGVFYGGMASSEAEFRQLKAHGLDAIQCFWPRHWSGVEFKNVDGKLKLNFAGFDAMVEKFQKAGMRGPLILSGTGSHDGYFEDVCSVMKVSLDTIDTPATQQFFIDGWKQLFDHAAEKKYPEIIWLPNDEPTTRKERAARMTRHKRTVKLLRDNFPKVRVYGVVMDKLDNAKLVVDYCDIIVCNGDTERILDLAKEKNKAVWSYGVASAAYGYQGVRASYGMNRFALGTSGMFFWCLNYLQDDPYNDFDGPRPDSVYIPAWPPLKKGGPLVESISFEGLRDGVNDVRYALTLEKLLEKSKDPKAEKIKADYQELKKGQMRQSKDTPATREKVAAWILQLGTN
jgi:hypothetical protein